jgi:aspartate/methionine/tyrosine aminotransferase
LLKSLRHALISKKLGGGKMRRWWSYRPHEIEPGIFVEVGEWVERFKPLDLSTGFPDLPGPEEVKYAAIEAICRGVNQYTPSFGAIRLRQAIANHYRQFYGWVLDPYREVTVTHGATEGIIASILAVVNPGDEVIIFEPFYDSFAPDVVMAGGRPVFVPLRPPLWDFDPDELKKAVSDRTRLIILNSPHNPTGKVFSKEELESIARLAIRHDLLVLYDVVYEHLVFEGEHIHLATLPGMAERTITAGSFGKTFGLTGWMIGWVVAPPPITEAIRRIHQFTSYCAAAPLQEAAAFALGMDERFFREIVETYRQRRDFLASALEEVGFKVLRPQGTYYLLADFSPLSDEDDRAFCLRLIQEAGVATIPISGFYRKGVKSPPMLRFCFAKKMETLEEAIARLRRWVRKEG